MKTNLTLTAISIGTRILTGFLVFILLARLWEPAEFGSFTFVFSVSALLVLLVDFGFSSYLLREIGARPDQATRLIADAFWAKATLILLYFLASGVTFLVIGSTTIPLTVFIPLLIATLAYSFADFFVAPLRALGHYAVETRVVAVSNVAHFLLIAWVVWLDGTQAVVAWSFAIGRILFLITSVFAVIRVIPDLYFRYSGTCNLIRALQHISPYGTDNILTSIWSQADIVAVRAIYGPQAVGLYAAGQKVVQGVSTLAPVVGNVMIPRLSKLAYQKSRYFHKEAKMTTGMMLVIGSFFGIPLILFPEQSTHSIFGDKYAELAELMPYFATILMLRYLAAGAGVIITALGLQKKRVIAQLFGIAAFTLATALAYATPLAISGFLIGYAGALCTVILFYWNARRHGGSFVR